MALVFAKSGGGFLNGETGTIVGITFDSKTWGEGDKAYDTISAKIDILQDGQTEPVSQFLPAGFMREGWEISEDGTTFESKLEGGIIDPKSDFARFLTSLVEAGLPEEVLGDCRSFTSLAGYRVTFGKELNRERQLAAGKKKLGKKAAGATEEEIMAAGKRQDKQDKTKFYNHDRLIVTAVLGQEEAPKAAKKTAAKAAPKSGAAKGGKANGAAKSAAADDSAYESADAILIDLLADAPENTIATKSLSSLIVRKALADGMSTADRESLRKLMGSEAFQSRQNGWVLDGGNLTLA
jgi:hypothetical protein